MANPSRLIAWFTFILGAILFIGGIIIGLKNINGASTITLLGQQISTGSVGLAICFIGVVMVVFTFRRIIIHNPVPKGALHLQIIVHGKESGMAIVRDAMVTLLLAPDVQRKKTDDTGCASFFYQASVEGNSYEIVVEHPEFENTSKRIRLKDGDVIHVDLKKKLSDRKNGKILYKIPAQMKVNEEVSCVVRISLSDIADAVISKNLKVEPVIHIEGIRASSVMSVQIRNEQNSRAFEIHSISTEEQSLDPDADYTEWIFKIKALRLGTYKLVFKVIAHLWVNENFKIRKKDVVVLAKPVDVTGYEGTEAAFEEQNLIIAPGRKSRSRILSKNIAIPVSIGIVVITCAGIFLTNSRYQKYESEEGGMNPNVASAATTTFSNDTSYSVSNIALGRADSSNDVILSYQIQKPLRGRDAENLMIHLVDSNNKVIYQANQGYLARIMDNKISVTDTLPPYVARQIRYYNDSNYALKIYLDKTIMSEVKLIRTNNKMMMSTKQEVKF